MTVDRLLEEHRVAVAPGEGFGARGAGWVAAGSTFGGRPGNFAPPHR